MSAIQCSSYIPESVAEQLKGVISNPDALYLDEKSQNLNMEIPNFTKKVGHLITAVQNKYYY